MLQKKWFEEGLNDPNTVKFKGDTEFIIYKGVKLEKANDGLRLFDVRFSDFYTKLPKKDKKLLKKHGFIKGCDYIMYNRDGIRCSKYKKRLEELYTNIDYYRKNLRKRGKKKYFTKKIKVANDHIRENMELLIFYGTRRDQFEIKYKLN